MPVLFSGDYGEILPPFQPYLSTLTSKGSLVIEGHVRNHTWTTSDCFPYKKKDMSRKWLSFHSGFIFFHCSSTVLSLRSVFVKINFSVQNSTVNVLVQDFTW